MDPEHWNVLVILADQLTASAMSCAGNTDVATPNLDRLATRGARFTDAYCTQPLCTPSRASLLTGRTPTQLSVRNNAQRLGPGDLQDSLGQIFSRAGYDCGYAGKWHVPELDAPRSSGFTLIHPETEEGLGDACGEFLAMDRDRPFLLVASLTEPHGICEWARGQTPPSGFVPEADWRNLPPLRENYPVPAYEAELPRIAQSHSLHANPTVGWSSQQWRGYLYAYYRLCERADALVGQIVRHLEDSGQAANTLIVFSSDHGDQLGAHGWSQKWVLYEESVHVPLIVVEPHHPEPGECRRELVSNGLDLLPTLTAAAGIPCPPGAQGRSLLSSDRGCEERAHLFAETSWAVAGLDNLTGRMVRNRQYKYTCYAWGKFREQLVDLDADPGELRNLAQVGAYAQVLRDMRELLRAECVWVGDPTFARFIPDPEAGPM